jgi:hypothetical protein
MERCENCRYWEPRPHGFGYCDGVDRLQSFEIIVRVSDDTGLSAKLQTGPQFKCNFYREVEKYG